MAKSCKRGYYYCNTSKKCKKIPKGYHVMSTGYLMRDSEHQDEKETEGKKKNGNGNGNHSNGNGNGNGSSSDGGGEGGGGGVQSTKNPSIAIIQKDSLRKPTVGVEKR